jgi:hypothetical protein
VAEPNRLENHSIVRECDNALMAILPRAQRRVTIGGTHDHETTQTSTEDQRAQARIRLSYAQNEEWERLIVDKLFGIAKLVMVASKPSGD